MLNVLARFIRFYSRTRTRVSFLSIYKAPCLPEVYRLFTTVPAELRQIPARYFMQQTSVFSFFFGRDAYSSCEFMNGIGIVIERRRWGKIILEIRGTCGNLSACSGVFFSGRSSREMRKLGGEALE